MKKVLVICGVLLAVLSKGQSVNSKLYADSDAAYEISDTGSTHFTAPKGFGDRREFSNNGWDHLHVPEAEHNSVWVSFKTEFDCDIRFTLTPDDPSDDYDFLLYALSPGQSARAAVANSIPVRTNFARNIVSQGGVTGLRKGANGPYVKSGPGQNFSRPFKAKAGQEFLIMIDRVKEQGSGFNLHIDNCYLRSFISMVKEVYSPEPEVVPEPEPEVIKFVPGSFVAEPGVTFHLSAVQFYSLKAIAKNGAQEQLDSLVNFMRLNPSYKVRLHGHTNTDNETRKFTIHVPESEQSSIFSENKTFPIQATQQELSHRRAMSVCNYLTQNGIDASRIETKGWGGTKRMFENPETVRQRLLNMRVEVEVF